MENVVQHPVVRQFVKFGLVGVLSAAIDWGVFFALKPFFGPLWAIPKGISFVVSAVNSYIWNRRWTFRSDNPNKTTEFTRFFAVACVGLGLNELLMFLMLLLLAKSTLKEKMRYLAGLFVATAVVAIWNFVVNRLWTFKK